jgi:hypothetical protein
LDAGAGFAAGHERLSRSTKKSLEIAAISRRSIRAKIHQQTSFISKNLTANRLTQTR